MKEEILLDDETLEKEDKDYIKKEMNEAIEKSLKEVNDELENNPLLDKETEEIFATNDINERVAIFKKYHPNDNRFE